MATEQFRNANFKMSMSKVNVQYSNRTILESVFKCKICGKQLLMFGCPDSECENYYKNSVGWKR